MKIKQIVAGTVIIVLALCYVINASAVVISVDGNMNSVEWDNAEQYLIINGNDKNCDITYALMKVIVDNTEQAVNFCFNCLSNDLEQDNTNAGVSISVDSAENVVSNAVNSPLSYDVTKHKFDAYTKINASGGFVCEIRVGFKDGVPEEIPVRLQFIDANGEYSNVYRYTITNNDYSDTQESVLSDTTATESVTTTKRVTTKASTTKKSTTTKKTTTTKRSEVTSDRDVFTDLNSVTTAQKTTTQTKTTKSATEKTTRQKTEKATTIVYYIINNITNVVHSSPTKETPTTTKEEKENTKVTESTYLDAETVEQSVKALLDEESNNKKHIKRTAIACGAILGAAALWGVGSKNFGKPSAKSQGTEHKSKEKAGKN